MGGRPKLTALIGGRTTKYDEAEFLVGGKGTGPGETARVTFKVHEGYLSDAEILLKSGKFPYKTLTDLVRHALVRHVWYLKGLEPEEIEGSVLYQLAQIDELVAQEEFQIRFVKNIEGTAKMVRGVAQMPGGKGHIGRTLRRIARHIGRMRLGFWKSYYEKLFRDEFGAYLRDGLALISIGGAEGEDGDDGQPVIVQEGDGSEEFEFPQEEEREN